ncbi:uncharacterized protein Z518_01996 [Rhinocladiella mackenziei CBS 650.93]|uniref:Zn(2)-C6 fungal-type domain-containing protein n=1 Tax=Rhinocladiella mackenziei CBS 650.93 TaxID=1442369 RepID=A0A0D2HA35_9EURO|nr:uncharacterized protein Z518_01996 [Rhinocladiella mackenziei CBS 650.93]KIX07343.1 hypothetical protein Z518_01996 [Rhinocladiella mackenziei CBS 650.93]
MANISRSQKGCLVCKTRKVKCDETASGCVRCYNLGLQCPGYDSRQGRFSSSQASSIVKAIYHDAGRERRSRGACDQCRQAKIRCNQLRPCQRCEKRNLHCTITKRAGSRTAQHDQQLTALNQQPQDSHSSGTPCSFPGTTATAALSNGDADVAHMQQLLSTEANAQAPESDQWLFSDNIPDQLHLLSPLIDRYFERVHSIRGLNFIHRPSFMRALQEGTLQTKYGSALLHIVCAFGALYMSDRLLKSRHENMPGCSWASKAQCQAFHDLGSVSVQNLMALVLLWEYHVRYGSHSSSLMIAACCSRAAQLLRLDVDHQGDGLQQGGTLERITTEESHRRLFWACWFIDVAVGAGVDRLLTISRNIPDVPLPRCEQDFIYQISTTTEKVAPSDFVEGERTVDRSQQSLEAWCIRINYLRGLTLRCVRDGYASPLPWETGSPFRQLVQQLQNWAKELPPHLQLSEENAYIHRDQRQLATWIAMHVTYHVVHCDLFRVTMPSYTFPIGRLLERAPPEFIRIYQQECKYHAEMISRVFQLGLKHGSEALDDTICRVCAYESCRIQIITTRMSQQSRSPEWLAEIWQNLETNLVVLDLAIFHPDQKLSCFRSLMNLLGDSSLFELPEKWVPQLRLLDRDRDCERALQPDNPQSQDHLHPLALFRVAWDEITTAQTPRDKNNSTDPPHIDLSASRSCSYSADQIHGPSGSEQASQMPASATSPATREASSISGAADGLNAPTWSFEPDTSGNSSDTMVDPFAPWELDVPPQQEHSDWLGKANEVYV